MDRSLYDSWFWSRLENPILWRASRSYRNRGWRAFCRRYLGFCVTSTVAAILFAFSLYRVWDRGWMCGHDENEELYASYLGWLLKGMFFVPLLWWLYRSLVGGVEAIATERDGRSWEPLIATGLPPAELVAGLQFKVLWPILCDIAAAAPMYCLFALCDYRPLVQTIVVILILAVPSLPLLTLVGMHASLRRTTRRAALFEAQASVALVVTCAGLVGWMAVWLAGEDFLVPAGGVSAWCLLALAARVERAYLIRELCRLKREG